MVSLCYSVRDTRCFEPIKLSTLQKQSNNRGWCHCVMMLFSNIKPKLYVIFNKNKTVITTKMQYDIKIKCRLDR